MALRCFNQLELAATTDTDIVSSGSFTTGLEIASLWIANRTGGALTFRVWMRKQNEADANKQYLFYDYPINPNDAFSLQVGWGMEPGDVLKVRASGAGLSVNLFVK